MICPKIIKRSSRLTDKNSHSREVKYDCHFHDNMVNHINFEQLTASNEVACDFNVRFGWSGIHRLDAGA